MAEHTGAHRGHTQPSGRDEIMEAIIEAATELFAEKGPARVTVREIATRAGVPHSVVFRYFGDKQAVLLEVLRRGSARQTEIILDPDFGTAMDRFKASIDNRSYRVAVIQAFLDGLAPDEIPGGLPEVRATLGQIQARPPLDSSVSPRVDPRVVAAYLAAATVGWDLTEDFYMKSLGIPADELESVRAQVLELLMLAVEHANT